MTGSHVNENALYIFSMSLNLLNFLQKDYFEKLKIKCAS